MTTIFRDVEGSPTIELLKSCVGENHLFIVRSTPKRNIYKQPDLLDDGAAA